MATVAASDRGAPPEVNKDPLANIPDVIEDQRKDADGRLITSKYMRGKLLGKVRCNIKQYWYRIQLFFH